MKYVLDSNVALKWVLPELDAAKAIRIRDEFHQGIHELLSPDVFPIEVAHSLARAERRGEIKHGEDYVAVVLAMTAMDSSHVFIRNFSRRFENVLPSDRRGRGAGTIGRPGPAWVSLIVEWRSRASSTGHPHGAAVGDAGGPT